MDDDNYNKEEDDNSLGGDTKTQGGREGIGGVRKKKCDASVDKKSKEEEKGGIFDGNAKISTRQKKGKNIPIADPRLRC